MNNSNHNITSSKIDKKKGKKVPEDFNQMISCLFPEIFAFSDSQDNKLAQQIMEKILKWFNTSKIEPKSFKSILMEKDVQYVQQKLKALQNHEYSFISQYGCLIDFYKQQSFSPTQLYLIFPIEWSFGSIIKEGECKYIPCNANRATYLFVGAITHGSFSIKKQKQLYMENLNGLIENKIEEKKNGPKKDQRKNHHTPTWLLQVAKQSCKKFNNGEIEDKKIKKKENSSQTQTQTISKGGTLDVGDHLGITKPNTSFEIVKDYLFFLIEDQQLINLIILDFQFYYIRQQIRSFSKVQILQDTQQQVKSFSKLSVIQDKKYRQCIQFLVYKIKKLTDNQISYNESVAKDKIEEIYQLLHEYFEPKNGQFVALKNLYKTTQMSLDNEDEDQFIFNSIRAYDYYNVQSVKHSGVLGFSSPLRDIKNFTQLLSIKYEESLWIMMVQQFFFHIAKTKLGPKNISIDIKLAEIKCNNSNNFSIMHQVINRYQSIMKKANKIKIYGLMLQNQTYGHLYLIKYIGAAIAFQVIRRENKNRKSNLQEYRIPQDIGKLYSLFYSLSYESRQAITAMLDYSTRNRSKSQIFSLDGTNRSFYIYANIIADQDEKIIQWKAKSKSQLLNQISNLEKQFSNFKIQYEAAKIVKNQITIRQCECTQEFVQKYYKIVRVSKKCLRCKELNNIDSKIRTLQNQKGKYIVNTYPQHQINLYGFIKQTPPDILGMMKIIYEAQVNIITPQNSHNPGNFFTQSYAPMIPHTSQVKGGQFYLYTNYQRPAQLFIKYPSKMTKNIYRDISQKMQISQKLLTQDKLQNSEMELRYQFMINAPEINNSKRQHQNYSKLYYKGKQENIQEFLAFANVRVSKQTQLMILGQKIKNRQLFTKSLISNSNIADNKDDKQRGKYAKMLIILKAVADKNSLIKINQQTQELIYYPMIEECILDMLENYQQQWRYEDMYFLHIVGIIFSLFSVEIKKPKYAVHLAQRAYKQYQKYSNQIGVDNRGIKSQLSYFLHGMLSCYTEDITKDMNAESIQIWTKIMILLRVNKVFSDQNIKDTRFRQTMIFYDHFRCRAVFKNIDNAKEYFIKHLPQLTKIIKIIDKDIPSNTKWKHNSAKGQYAFIGIGEESVYDLNLFTGIVLKNNGQVAGLPEIIKRNQKYIAIFDTDRDLQIFYQKDGSLRTRTDFSQYFPNQSDTTILFQFKIQQKDIIIRMIIKRGEKTFKYVLISEDILNDSNFNIPVIYRKEYFAWYCQSEKNIVFREKKLNKMCNIGLILLVKVYKNQIIVKEGRIIQNKFKKQSLEYLKLRQNSHLFDHITFFVKTYNQSNQFKHPNLGFKILNSIELPDYIIQTVSHTGKKGQNKIIKFWLHRYNLKFTLSQQHGLLSDNYQGYSICPKFNSYELLPWGTYEKINCLILQKTQRNIRFAKNHEKIVLIPDTSVNLDHKNQVRNQILQGQTKNMRMFSYQIHDFYKDMRSKTKLEQLHLACLIASCYVPMFQPLMMTNIQYAIQIMRSCINPVPLSPEQFVKLENIFKNSLSLNQLPLILMSQVIYQTSNSLKYILPYNNGHLHGKDKQIKATLFDLHCAYVDNCKDKYCFSLKEQKISIREKLNQLELKILNISKGSRATHKSYKQSRKWNIKNQISFAKNDKIEQVIEYWKNKIKQYTDNITRIIQIPPKEQTKIQANPQLQFTLNLDKNDKMSQQKYQQIKSSLNSYSIIKQKFDKIHLSAEDKNKFLKQLEKQSFDVKKIKEYILQ